MKKQSQHSQRKKRKKTPKKKTVNAKKSVAVNLEVESPQKEPVKQKIVRNAPKKASEKKGDKGLSVLKNIGKAGQFIKESKMELKKVKWPTRKEMMASTAVVIVLTLFIALYLGLVDFGLIKIIKSIVR